MMLLLGQPEDYDRAARTLKVPLDTPAEVLARLKAHGVVLQETVPTTTREESSPHFLSQPLTEKVPGYHQIVLPPGTRQVFTSPVEAEIQHITATLPDGYVVNLLNNGAFDLIYLPGLSQQDLDQ